LMTHGLLPMLSAVSTSWKIRLSWLLEQIPVT
jgi:hypothetical protein